MLRRLVQSEIFKYGAPVVSTLIGIWGVAKYTYVEPQAIQFASAFVEDNELVYTRINLRKDCVRSSISVILLRENATPIYAYFEDDSFPQGPVGAVLERFPLKIPSKATPGLYSVNIDDAYRCGKTTQTYRLPDEPLTLDIGS